MTPDEFYMYFEKVVFPNVKICENMILDIVNIDRDLVKFYVNKYIQSDKIYSVYPSKQPEVDYKVLLTNITKFIKKKYSQKGLDRFLTYIPDNKYNIVFDGNNILLNKAGSFEKESYDKLVKLYKDCIDKGLNPVIFIHTRIVKVIKRAGLKLNFNYIGTPYRYNDDWFSLYYAIKYNINLVSRDIYRDHINQFDTQKKQDYLKIFLAHKRYNITEDFRMIIFENKQLPIVCEEDDYYYIPGNKGYLKV
jgi:hypothetical protein